MAEVAAPLERAGFRETVATQLRSTQQSSTVTEVIRWVDQTAYAITGTAPTSASVKEIVAWREGVVAKIDGGVEPPGSKKRTTGDELGWRERVFHGIQAQPGDGTEVIDENLTWIDKVVYSIRGTGGPYEQFHSTMRTALESAIRLNYPSIPIQWPNGDTVSARNTQVWVEVWPMSTETRLIGWGGKKRARMFGRLVAILRSPAHIGDGDALRLVDEVRKGLRNYCDNGVQFGSVDYQVRGRDEFNAVAWHRIDITIDTWKDREISSKAAIGLRQPDPDAEFTHSTLRLSFKTFIQDVRPGLFALYDNDDERQNVPPHDAPWCMVSVAGASTSLFQDSEERSGEIKIMILEPPGDGTGESQDLADQTFEALACRQVFDVQIGVPSLATVGRTDSDWWLSVLSVPYRLRETVPGLL